MINTRAYEVEFIYGTTETLTYNIITNTLLAQVNKEGHNKLLPDEIIDYQSNSDMVHSDYVLIETLTGMRR